MYLQLRYKASTVTALVPTFNPWCSYLASILSLAYSSSYDGQQEKVSNLVLVKLTGEGWLVLVKLTGAGLLVLVKLTAATFTLNIGWKNVKCYVFEKCCCCI